MVTKAPPKALGKLSSGALAITSWQPTPLQVADRINDCLTLQGDLSTCLPLPEDMDLCWNEANRQVQLCFRSRVYALRLRKAFGYMPCENTF